jgi:hypothetical protein
MAILNILTRTSARPNYFRGLRDSLLQQQFDGDMMHIVSTDNDDPYVEGDIVLHQKRPSGNYPYNLYFNEMIKSVPDGWVLHLDDDDELTTPYSLQTMADAITSEDDLLLWKVRLKPNRIVPKEMYRTPQIGQISGIGFLVHRKHWIDWPKKQCGDGYVIREYYKKLRPVWMDKILTGRQPPYREGLAQRNDKC